jgi:hypothetical protein
MYIFLCSFLWCLQLRLLSLYTVTLYPKFLGLVLLSGQVIVVLNNKWLMSQCTKFHDAGRMHWTCSILYDTWCVGCCFCNGFKNGTMSVSGMHATVPLKIVITLEGPSAGQYSTFFAKVQHLIYEYWCWSIQNLAVEVEIRYGIWQKSFIHELGICHVAAKFVQSNLPV